MLKMPVETIETYNISDLHTRTGNSNLGNDVFVYKLSELPNGDKEFRPFRTKEFTIYLHLHGRLEIKVNLIKYVKSQKCLVIIPPGVVREKVAESADCDAMVLGFTPEFFSKTIVQKNHIDKFGFFSSLFDPMYLLTDTEAEILCNLMLAIKSFHGNTLHPFAEDLVHHSFCLFMYEMAGIVKESAHANTMKRSRNEDILIQFARMMMTHFKEERSVQYYADALFMTPKHLTKTVKEITGKTSGELIDEMVITEAKILLSDFSYSVAQVADHLHFSDQFFFSKFFKNQTGLSPTEYKNSI